MSDGLKSACEGAWLHLDLPAAAVSAGGRLPADGDAEVWPQIAAMLANRPVVAIEIIFDVHGKHSFGMDAASALFDWEALVATRAEPGLVGKDRERSALREVDRMMEANGFRFDLGCAQMDWDGGQIALRWHGGKPRDGGVAKPVEAPKEKASRTKRRCLQEPLPGIEAALAALAELGQPLMGPWKPVVSVMAMLSMDSSARLLDRLGEAGMLEAALAALQARELGLAASTASAALDPRRGNSL